MISVTQVLSPFIDWSQISPERLEHAGQRGTKIHAYNAAYLLGLWLPKIDAECQGYFDSFRYFADARIDKVLFVEAEFICDCFQYIGHVDFVGVLKGEEGASVIDWKSPLVMSPTWPSQISAYCHLVEKHGRPPGNLKIKRCGALMLSPHGKTANFKEYTESRLSEFNAFLAALNAYRWFKCNK